MKYFLLSALLLSVPSFAGDLLLGQYSYHFEDCVDRTCPNQYLAEKNYRTKEKGSICEFGCNRYEGKFRDTHPLIGYTNRKYTAFIMKNSYDNMSVVVMRNFTYEWTKNLRPSASIGLATGYDEHLPSWGKLTPMGVFSLDIHPDSDKFGLIISTVPTKWISAGIRIKFN